MKMKIFPIIALIIALGVAGLWFSQLSNKNKAQKRIAIVSFIYHPIFNTIQESFKSELAHQLGDSVKYTLIENNAQGNLESLPVIARDIAAKNPDLIIPISTPVTQALLRVVTPAQPVIYTFVSNPSNLGDMIEKTNTTGLSDVINYQANIDLIKQIIGDRFKLGVMYNPNEANSVGGVNEIKSILTNSGITLLLSTVTSEAQIPIAAEQLASKVNVILVIGDNTVGAGAKVLINAAYNKRVPVFAIDEGSVRDLGAVGGMSVDYAELGKRTAIIAARVIKEGVNPSSINKEFYKGDKLVFNKKAIAELGLKVPDTLLARSVQY